MAESVRAWSFCPNISADARRTVASYVSADLQYCTMHFHKQAAKHVRVDTSVLLLRQAPLPSKLFGLHLRYDAAFASGTIHLR